MGGFGTWLRLWRQRPMLTDVLGAVVLAAVTVSGSIGEAYPSRGQLSPGQTVPHPPAAAYVLVAVASLVLIWRRRWPVGTFAVSLGCVLLYTGFGYVNGAAVIAPMVGLYTVAVQRPVRQALVAAGIALVSLMLVTGAFQPFGITGGPQTVIPVEVPAVLFLGLAVANRRAYVASVEDRAERAERTREEEARRRVDAERLRIARELHDVVAHNISMINVQARAAAAVIVDPPPAGAQALAAIKDASADALRELRAILGLLRAADEAEPTEPAQRLDQLDALVAATTRAGLPTTVAVRGDPFPLAATVDLAAYRIVQESLTNALRYAVPAAAAVSLTYHPDRLTIEVCDDGKGAGGANSPGSGHGIVGMRERARALGGEVQAGPRPEGGFRVQAELPAERPA